MTTDTTLVYLVWAPSGSEYLRRFLDSYGRNPPGAAHELLLLYNGISSAEEESEFDRVAASTPHTKFVTESPVLDLEAYRQLLEQHRSRFQAFVSTYSRPQVSDWLSLMLRHAQREEVGLVGCTGSWESMASNSPLITRPLRLTQFKSFPNPHVRSGSFVIRDDVLDRVRWPKIGSKLDAWKFENGRHGLSAQVLQLGLELVVAGRDGTGYAWRNWQESETFRSGEQKNLIVADNRTDDWMNDDRSKRDELARLAWGRHEAS